MTVLFTQALQKYQTMELTKTVDGQDLIILSDNDGDVYTDGVDCDDNNAFANPGASRDTERWN